MAFVKPAQSPTISLELIKDSRLVDLECKPADGVVGQTTNISCSFIASVADQHITVITVFVYKNGQKDPLFTIKNGSESGDARFRLPSVSDPSLELTDTALTDEGEYLYMLLTNRGIIKDGVFRISVTAKYNEPATNSWPENIVEGQGANLYCNASGGYPAGVIHWFDKINTDWTKSATLTIKEGEDKLLQLSSKLSFPSIDPSWAPFRCVVLNSRNVQEGESTFQLKMTGDDPGSPVTVTVGVVVGGFIVIVALIALLFYRKRIQRKYHQHSERMTVTCSSLRLQKGRSYCRRQANHKEKCVNSAELRKDVLLTPFREV
ncbi:uncharacterized protein [Salminus brasiliensis]|uniref:uncharacterized protein isoform X2 n=1 Tax=Salminus brasiliensis TaxID=930266 RepID=UPI003B835ABD